MEILLNGEVDVTKICKIQSLGVNTNCRFIVDLNSVDIEDLKADDLGSWKGTGARLQIDDYGIPTFCNKKAE